MFKKDGKEVSSNKVNTVIGKGTYFQGNLKTSGIVRVDGEMEGEIATRSDVVIGESGKVRASVKAKNVAIAGTVEGNVEAEDKMDLKKTGTLLGDVVAQHLSIDDGAIFKGNCYMKSKNEGKQDKKTRSSTKLEGNGRHNKQEGEKGEAEEIRKVAGEKK